MLAARYPELGMPAELISAAITRAAGMVGESREAPADPAWPRRAAPEPPPDGAIPKAMPNGATGSVTNGANDAPHAAGSNDTVALPVSSTIDEALATAIDAEIGAFVSDQAAQAALHARPVDHSEHSHSGDPGQGGVMARLRRSLRRQ